MLYTRVVSKVSGLAAVRRFYGRQSTNVLNCSHILEDEMLWSRFVFGRSRSQFEPGNWISWLGYWMVLFSHTRHTSE